MVDPDGTIRYVSPTVSRTLGHAPGELDGADLMALVHPDDVPTDLLALAQPDEQGIGSPVVMRVRTSEGSWRHLEVIVTDLTQNPAIGGLVLNARDVTDRVVAARQLASRAFTDPLTELPEPGAALRPADHHPRPRRPARRPRSPSCATSTSSRR